MTLQQQIEVIGSEAIKTLILKIQIEHLVPLVAFSEQPLYAVIEHKGLSSSAHTNKNPTGKPVELNVSRLNDITLNFLLVLAKNLFQNLLIHLLSLLKLATKV